MAEHMREQVAAAVLAATTGLATTGANVFRGRVRSFTVDELPGGNILTRAERIEPKTLPRPRMQDRHLQVDWVAQVRKIDGYETELNKIVKEVEVALAAPAVVVACGAKTISLRYIGAPVDVQNEVVYAQVTISFEVWYLTSEYTPDVAQ